MHALAIEDAVTGSHCEVYSASGNIREEIIQLGLLSNVGIFGRFDDYVQEWNEVVTKGHRVCGEGHNGAARFMFAMDNLSCILYFYF